MIYGTLYADNVERHEAKARKWSAEGKPEYAAGSMRKAAKWRARDRERSMMLHGAYPKTELQSLIEDHISRVERSLAAEFESFIYG